MITLPLKAQPNKNIYFFLLAAAILCWGIGWPVNKLALAEIPPLWLGTLRFAIATVCIFTFLLLSKKLQLPRRADMPILISIALLQMTAFVTLTNFGLLYSGVGRSTILAYTTPLWTTPLALLIFKEPLSPLKLVGLILGLAGVIVLFNPFSFNWHDSHILIGNSLLLLAALGWAICIVHARVAQWHLSPLQLLPWQLLIATFLLLLLALHFEPHWTVRWSPHLLGYVFYVSIFATALGYWLGLEISKNLPSITTSLCLLGVPVLGVAISHLFLGETITLAIYTSLLLIISGVVCVICASVRSIKISGENNEN